MWKKWLSSIGYLLLGELALFSVVRFIFPVSWSDLVGPYLAFALSMMITLLLFWRLNIWWSNRKPSPRRLALSGCLVMFLFLVMVVFAWIYLGMAVGLLSPAAIYDDWGAWAFAITMTVLAGVFAAYQSSYRIAKAQMAASASDS